MRKLNPFQKSVINSILWSLEGCFEQDELIDNDFVANVDNFVLSLTEAEYIIFKDLAKTGI